MENFNLNVQILELEELEEKYNINIHVVSYLDGTNEYYILSCGYLKDFLGYDMDAVKNKLLEIFGY